MSKVTSMCVLLAAVVGGTAMAAAGGAKYEAPQLEPGLWQVTELDRAKNRTRAMCLADPELLVQVEHGGAPCSRLLLSREAGSITVHYTCPRGGFGRTILKVRSPQRARLDTQGILADAPFAYRADARRLGPCNRTAARRPAP